MKIENGVFDFHGESFSSNVDVSSAQGVGLNEVPAGLDFVAHEHCEHPIRLDRIVDLHVWQIGHGCRAATVTVVSDAPRSPDEYRAMIPAEIGIVHATVEVQRCPEAHS